MICLELTDDMRVDPVARLLNMICHYFCHGFRKLTEALHTVFRLQYQLTSHLCG